MTDFSKGGAIGLDANSTDNVGVITNRVDFSKVNATAAAHKVLNIPANCKVKNVVAQVLVAEGSAGVATVGPSGNADGYIVSFNLNAVGITSNSGDVAETSVGVLVTTANGVYFTPAIALDTAIIRFSAELVDFNFSESLI